MLMVFHSWGLPRPTLFGNARNKSFFLILKEILKCGAKTCLQTPHVSNKGIRHHPCWHCWVCLERGASSGQGICWPGPFLCLPQPWHSPSFVKVYTLTSAPPPSPGLLKSQQLLWKEMCPIKYKNCWRRFWNKGDWMMILTEAERHTEEWKQIICRLAVKLVHLRNRAILSLSESWILC